MSEIKANDGSIYVSSSSLALSGNGLPEVKAGYCHVFPRIVIIGDDTGRKQQLVTQITGLDVNWVSSRKLEITFHKTNEKKDFVKMGGFGGNTYKVKNLIKRLVEEDKDPIDKPFKVAIYSPNVKRECTVVVLPVKWDNYELFKPDIIVNTDDNIDYAKVIEKQNVEAKVTTIPKLVEENEKETYEFYYENVMRFAQRQDKQIFRNIIDKKTNEEIIYECDDFIFVRDILWADSDIKNIHYLVIFKNPKYMSIRDLSSNDIELLNNALTIGEQQIKKRHDVSGIKMETYFHYHPSIWLMHIHFVSSTVKENHKKFMTAEVIENLKKDSEYYRKHAISL
jgi:diadenosine tetraphosphate (Ap4A) HIT family hydrolase